MEEQIEMLDKPRPAEETTEAGKVMEMMLRDYPMLKLFGDGEKVPTLDLIREFGLLLARAADAEYVINIVQMPTSSIDDIEMAAEQHRQEYPLRRS